MIIQDKLRDFNGSSLYFNFYHRVHTSLIKNTKVFLRFSQGLKGKDCPELIISPFDSNSWDDLWRITITLNDQIGVVNDVLSTLKERNLNILSLETNSISGQKLHQMEILVDARRYASYLFDKTSGDRKSKLEINELKDLKRDILSRIIDNIYFVVDKPRIKINRVYGLWEASNHFLTQNDGDFSDYRPTYDETFVKTGEENYQSEIPLPIHIKLEILKSLGVTEEEFKQKNHGYKYLTISDTKDRFLTVYFFKPTEQVIGFTLQHRDLIGAIALITSSLRHAGFNILTSHSRLSKFGESAITDFIVELTNKNLLNQSTEERDDQELDKRTQFIKNQIENALSTKDLIDSYKIEIDYSVVYDSKPNFRKLSKVRSETVKSDIKYTPIRIEQELSKYEDKIKKLKSPNEDVFKRYDLIKKLSAELLIDDSKKTEKKSVFISYAFDNPLWYGLAKRKIEELNLDLTSGKNLGSTHNSIREALKDRIEKSNFFLGIWTKSNGIQTIDKKWLPSQWLMWEFGIAEAKNKKWRLLISKDIDENVYKKIYNDIPHLLFNETDEIESFEATLQEAIDYFENKG
jgi:ACT domain-containing protein